ncbi:MAG: zf-HC2 domain-containing protein [Clostridiaceae bacterium]|nr:zf-HC2 domain-containing protein [Clostridiaceae bacterium]
MMIHCEIIRDLLPVYAAGDCSEITKTKVDEHIANCESCAKSLAAMSGPLVLTESSDEPEETEEIEREITLAKGMKKIRRRWIISILCVLLILSIAVLIKIAYNDSKGESLSFSNAEDVRLVNDFAKSLSEGDFAAAFEYFETDWIYESLIQDSFGSSISRWDYIKVIIDGVEYYTLAGNEKIQAIPDDLAPADFWAQIIVMNSTGTERFTPIPEEVFDEAVRLAQPLLTDDILVVDIMSEIPDSSLTYIRFAAEDGNRYYRPTVGGRLNNQPDWMNQSELIPQTMFDILIFENTRLHREARERTEKVRAIGALNYHNQLRNEYVEKLQALSDQGIRITSYSVGSPYRFDESFPELDGSSSSAFQDPWFVTISFGTSASDTEVISMTVQVIGNKVNVIDFYTSGDSEELVYMLTPFHYLSDTGTDYFFCPIGMLNNPYPVIQSVIQYDESISEEP